MSKLEAQYAEKYKQMIEDGELLIARYEEITFRLANNCGYTPDFVLLYPDGKIEVVELKAFWKDDARVKWKVAAETFPEYLWVAITCKSKQGKYLEVKREEYEHRDGWL